MNKNNQKKENYTIKLPPTLKKELMKKGTDFTRDILTMSLEYSYDVEVSIFLVEHEIRKLKDTYEGNNNEIMSMKKKITDLENENKEMENMIKEKNIELRGLYDIKKENTDNFNFVFNKMVKLINKDSLNVVSLEEILTDFSKNKRNKIIRDLINTVITSNDFEDKESIISILEKSLISEN